MVLYKYVLDLVTESVMMPEIAVILGTSLENGCSVILAMVDPTSPLIRHYFTLVYDRESFPDDFLENHRYVGPYLIERLDTGTELFACLFDIGVFNNKH